MEAHISMSNGNRIEIDGRIERTSVLRGGYFCLHLYRAQFQLNNSRRTPLTVGAEFRVVPLYDAAAAGMEGKRVRVEGYLATYGRSVVVAAEQIEVIGD